MSLISILKFLYLTSLVSNEIFRGYVILHAESKSGKKNGKYFTLTPWHGIEKSVFA
jgi:hypothetical protein